MDVVAPSDEQPTNRLPDKSSHSTISIPAFGPSCTSIHPGGRRHLDASPEGSLPVDAVHATADRVVGPRGVHLAHAALTRTVRPNMTPHSYSRINQNRAPGRCPIGGRPAGRDSDPDPNQACGAGRLRWRSSTGRQSSFSDTDRTCLPDFSIGDPLSRRWHAQLRLAPTMATPMTAGTVPGFRQR